MSNEVLKRLIEIKKEIGHLKKESSGVHGNCRSIYDTYLVTHDPFVKHGIIMTSGGLVGGNITWTFHCSEDDSSITTHVPMIEMGNQIFDAGKAISYSQKYAIISVLGLPDKSVNKSDPDITGPSSTEPKKGEPLPMPTKSVKKRVADSRGGTIPIIDQFRDEVRNQYPSVTEKEVEQFVDALGEVGKTLERPTPAKLNEIMDMKEMVTEAWSVITREKK